jgi:CheY-like chemotaxis protein
MGRLADDATQDKSPISNLQFEVEDTGPGIGSDELESVFDAFAQTTSGRQLRRGTGLGMSISRQFVCLMGGDLTVSSELGKGSIFKFELPVEVVDVSQIRARQPARRVIGLESGQPVYRLLIVEDVEASRRLLVKLLQPLGFQVRQAVNGQEAIEVWEEWQPHLIWMDMRLPVMDGREATRRIKATPDGQSTIIIALTASAFEEDRAAVLAEGCDDFVRKPFREAEIFDKMARRLGVRYLYEGTPLDLAQTEEGEQKPLTAADLAELPPEMLADLRQAAKAINLEKANTIIGQIGQTNEPLAQALAYLVENFRFDTLQTLVKEIEQ